MHLRLIVPHELEFAVLECLDAAVGVTGIVVVPGESRAPEGRLVLCDVAREAVDRLVRQLRELGLPERGAIAMADAGVVLSKAAEEAEREAPGEGADAVVWEAVTEVTHEESTLTLVYLGFMSVATMIAACGVILDNTILIVGAMVVGPDFGPLAGLCVGLVRKNGSGARRSLVALLVGFAVAVLVTVVFSLLMNQFGLFSRELFDGARPQTSFIWKPDRMSLVVAVLAGIAGMLSLTSAKSAALVGVAISVTTVPAAANAALALSYGDVGQFLGSLGQLGINLLGIVVAGSATLIAQQLFWARIRRT